MKLSPTQAPAVPLSAPNGQVKRARTPEEAAEQFESVLVRQFVDTMTKGLFEQSLSGDDAPGWMQSYSDAQRTTMTDTLTQHLVDSGTFRIADLLKRQWQQQGAEASTEMSTDPAPAVPYPTDAAPTPHALTDHNHEA